MPDYTSPFEPSSSSSSSSTSTAKEMAAQLVAQATAEVGKRRIQGSGWVPTAIPTAYWQDGDKRIPQYADMRKEDSAVKAALMAISLTILKHLGKYTHPDPAVADSVNAAINGVRGGRRRMIRGLLSALWAGYSISEVVWRVNGRSWEFDRVVTRHPLTFYPDGIRPEPSGDLTEFVQNRGKDNCEARIPAWKCVYWPFAQEFEEQLYGVSLLGSAYRYWYIKDQAVNWWALWAERHVNPIGIAAVPPGETYDPWAGKRVPNRELAMHFLQNLTAGSSIAFNRTGEGSWEFDWLQSDIAAGGAYQELIYAMDNGIFRAVLLPRLTIEEAKFGTRAQGETNLDFFLLNVEGIMHELGGSVLVDQLARPYIILNYGEQDDYGEWEWEELQQEDLKVWSEVLANLGNSGLVTFVPADERRAREVFARLLAPQDEADAYAVTNVAQQLSRYAAGAL